MSDVSVDIIKNRSGEAPDLPSGANLSGVSTAATLQVTNLNPTHINASGVTTATTFSGSLKSTGTPTLGLGVTINSSGLNISGVATAGIVSATTLYGDGSNLTGVAMSIAPITYNPDVNDSTVPTASGIGITFTERIIAGTGNVTLRIAGAAGTVVENFGVGSSVTISNNTVSIDPTSDLTQGETYYISYPSGTFKNTAGDVSYVGTAYTFGVKPVFTSLWSWGYQAHGQLGQNQGGETLYSSPVQIPGTNWDTGSRNFEMEVATKSDGTMWVWGANIFGSLGLNQTNNTNHRSSPTQLPGTTWDKGGALGYRNAYGIKTDGTLWTWGYNDKGQLGHNNIVYYSSPVQVGSDTTWSEFGSQYTSSTWALKTDGTFWMTGRNHNGNLGQNNRTEYSSPVQIPGTTWSNIAGEGIRYMLATKTDGTLWGWGNNLYGYLGQNTNGPSAQRSSAVQIPGTTWKDVRSSAYASAATKTDGTLWTWGINDQGQLGDNSKTNRSSPVQIPGTTWDFPISLSGRSLGSFKTDGTLWVWGYNNRGQLGLNNTTSYSSPIQIPGTTWDNSDIRISPLNNYLGGFIKKVEQINYK